MRTVPIKFSVPSALHCIATNDPFTIYPLVRVPFVPVHPRRGCQPVGGPDSRTAFSPCSHHVAHGLWATNEWSLFHHLVSFSWCSGTAALALRLGGSANGSCAKGKKERVRNWNPPVFRTSWRVGCGQGLTCTLKGHCSGGNNVCAWASLSDQANPPSQPS